jgi:hypothetical protein
VGIGQVGLLISHNTFIGEQSSQSPYSNAHFRNNLFLGRNAPNRGVMTWANATGDYSSDYNGFRPNPNVTRQYNWLAPAHGKTAYAPEASDRRSFSTLAEFQKATGQEAHGIELDYDIFENLSPPDPARRHHVYHSMDLNFRLKANSKAVDAALVLPTINDNFTGKAPDLGALELNQKEPHYGPRWITWKPFYR